ncbi:MAG: hypothetical protein GWP08_09650 [Nitrospiraceae bacterium]|nr:hypothetical protein [Nitrospiraceae bacterium]
MDVRVDSQAHPSRPQDEGDALAVLAQVSEALRARGRAIMSVKIDGEAVSADRLADVFGGKQPDDLGLVEVESEDIQALVQSSLNDLESLLPELPGVCHQLAGEFQGETPEAGFEPFHRFALIWQTIKEREIMVANALNVDLASLDVGAVSIPTMHRELNQFLDECAEALKTGDCVVLGDLLEYELAPRAEAEMGIVAALRERARAERA